MTEKEQLEKEYGITAEEARNALWRLGKLDFKLDENQQEMIRNFKESQSRTFVWNCSRRLGKSFSLSVLAIETCLQKKGAIVKFLSPTQKMVRTILRPLLREILADAPKDIRPEERVADGEWFFPSTGARIQLAGCDGGRAETVRGTNGDLCIIDEAGFVSKDLDYIVKSILLPLTTTTNGKIILASTPPVSPDHDFVRFYNQALLEGCAIRKTIYDNPRMTIDQINELARASGGHDSIGFKREFLAQIIKDDNYSVVPEFDETLKSKIVKPWVRPPHYDTYVAMDLGVKDLTVVLFAYYDFKANKLIIEDEYTLNGQKFNTKILAEAIKTKEDEIFTDPGSGERIDPYMRVSDVNLTVIQDLWQLHSLFFVPTKKDDADSALNNLRILVKDEKVIINPRCKTLINHLETATWNKSKTSYARSGDGFHYDAIDALKYLIRNVNFNKNPFPMGWGQKTGQNVYRKETNLANNSWAKIINFKK